MEVEVHLYSQSEPCKIMNAANAYTKDGLYCVATQDGPVYKWPLLHVFRIKESGGKVFKPPQVANT